MEQNRQIMELLQQIEKNSRRQARTGTMLCVLGSIAAVCCVVTLVTILGLMPQANEVIGQMQTVLRNLEQTSEQLAAADIGAMAADVDALVTTGQQSLEQTMQKLNTIDFEALNAAIEDLAAVVEPLSRFFGAFR